VKYHNVFVTIIWDIDGKKYNKGKGFSVWVNGKKIAQSEKLEKLSASF
jgi:hypothetical protein